MILPEFLFKIWHGRLKEKYFHGGGSVHCGLLALAFHETFLKNNRSAEIKKLQAQDWRLALSPSSYPELEWGFQQ